MSDYLHDPPVDNLRSPSEWTDKRGMPSRGGPGKGSSVQTVRSKHQKRSSNPRDGR